MVYEIHVYYIRNMVVGTIKSQSIVENDVSSQSYGSMGAIEAW
jgi:hypothetical protein